MFYLLARTCVNRRQDAYFMALRHVNEFLTAGLIFFIGKVVSTRNRMTNFATTLRGPELAMSKS